MGANVLSPQYWRSLVETSSNLPPARPWLFSGGLPRGDVAGHYAPVIRLHPRAPFKGLATGLSLWTLVMVLFGLPSQGVAQLRPRVVVLEFEGAPRLRAAIIDKLEKDYEIEPLDEWLRAAQDLGASGRADDEIAIVAGTLNVAAVVTALVRRDEGGEWMITIAPRHGPSGKPVDKLRYPLKSPYTARQLLEAIGPAVVAAIKGPPELPPVPSMPDLAPIPLPSTEPPEPLPLEPPQPRQRWYPYFDLSVGFILEGRRFGFDEQSGTRAVHCYDFKRPAPGDQDPNQVIYQYGGTSSRCPGYAGNSAPGMRVDASVYPFASLSSRWLRGLGVGGSFDIMGWPDGHACNKYVNGTCLQAGAALPTSEFRIEAGLRWTYNLLNKRSRPSILLSVQYGLHQFALQKSSATYEYPDPSTSDPLKIQGQDDHGLPDIRYQYVDLGFGVRVPFYGNKQWYLGMVLAVHYHVMLDYGELQTRFAGGKGYDALYQGGGYGPVSSGYGLRADLLPIELVPWKGMTIRLGGFYEVFSMGFALSAGGEAPPQDVAPGEAARHLAKGATDQYFGGVLQVGYQY